ncbi:polysaccharide deacetylase family protein [Variovorax sp. OV329]|uniref:polysaccharide deacetylase family protein n=1 Tax=Variovorax sp. OV329 TaxID=1882825 RepID=UPI0008E68DA5|nr:polysaccharide deacetylase family protein [Variovorax sp. OV329]SFM18163.1 Peptidoglycan/xylan/chitin deacetylase, PgdA/CDA1 family [Variovorax sp. OV329]
MARIALKVDVDTWRGTREGVPTLLRMLADAGAGASFLFSLGPDHTGRAIFRALRPGFLQKVSRTSVLSHYGWRTLLYGTLLPGPDIGRREAATLRAVRDAGFEVGVHCWDHVRWQDRLLAEGEKDPDWALREMRRATDAFADAFGMPARLHGAAGWQFDAHAARAQAELGIEYASDTRGEHAFLPVDESGTVLGPPQLPTTLPTLDELIGVGELTEANVHRHLLAFTDEEEADQVYTLHAELEGMRLAPVLARLLAGWRAQGHTLVALRDQYAALMPGDLPRHRLAQGSVEGRSGTLAVQGRAFKRA